MGRRLQIEFAVLHAADEGVPLVDADELAELAWCDYLDLTARIPTGLFEPVADYLRARLIRP